MRKIVKQDKPNCDLPKLLETLRAVRIELEASNDTEASLPDQLAHWHKVRQHYEAIKAIANEAEQLSRYMSYEQLPAAFRASRRSMPARSRSKAWAASPCPRALPPR